LKFGIINMLTTEDEVNVMSNVNKKKYTIVTYGCPSVIVNWIYI